MENSIISSSKYIPVSCDLVDQIEILATSKELTTLVIGKTEPLATITCQLKTWYTKDKEEFIIIGNNIHLRMDYIISIKGIKFESSCKL